MPKKLPIGIFDSGLGGLSAVKSIRAVCPREDIVYFGDTARVPYGSRSTETIKKYAREDAEFLLSCGVRAIVVACGTVSSVALSELCEITDVPVIGVVAGAAYAAALSTKNGRVGIIGTAATIDNGALERAVKSNAALLGKETETFSRACPLFVALVENGFVGVDCEITRLAVREYLAPIKETGADTLVLGCTHFPIISDVISDFLPGVRLINPAEEAVKELYARIDMNEGEGKTEYFVSDAPSNFDMLAEMFLGEKIKATVNTEKWGKR